METIGDRIKRLRLAQGMTQRDLDCPGVSYAYISRIEAGARRPSVKALRKIADRLGVTTAYLETGSDDVVDSPEYRELLELCRRLEEERDEAVRRVEELRAVLAGRAVVTDVRRDEPRRRAQA